MAIESSADRSDPPVLLTMPTFQGTLAAARCLGAHGVPVTVAGAEPFAPARWSRFARGVFCPRLSDPERFVSWLLRFGARHPGHLLYPCGDDVAFLFALHREALSAHFRLWQPPLEAVYTLLNKQRLYRACAEVGLDTPWTCLVDERELERAAATRPYPLMLKPQTQVLLWPHRKGCVARSPRELRRLYRDFTSKTTYSTQLLRHDPGVVRPMLQDYLPTAERGIYSLSGFVDETGAHAAIRGARKVLQRPRRVGVGLCFEPAETNDLLAARLFALCRRLGYFGVFEAEFIQQGSRLLLIDFNPRFYGQMAFDIARGLPLPLLVHEAALGRQERVRALLEGSARAGPDGQVFCNRAELGLLLRLQRLAGHMGRGEAARWRCWLRGHERLVDPLTDPTDPVPRFAHLAGEVQRFLFHPRSFLRELIAAP